MIYQILRKQEVFFTSLQQQAKLAVAAAETLLALVDSFDELDSYIEKINAIEADGDKLVEEINQHLARSFITPIDREDIHLLTTNLDSVTDYLNGCAMRLRTFHVASPTPEYRRLVELALAAAQAIEEALKQVNRGGKVAEYRRRVKAAEMESDRVSRGAIGELFGRQADVYELIKWKELYERMENALDRCEDVFDLLERLVVKYA